MHRSPKLEFNGCATRSNPWGLEGFAGVGAGDPVGHLRGTFLSFRRCASTLTAAQPPGALREQGPWHIEPNTKCASRGLRDLRLQTPSTFAGRLAAGLELCPGPVGKRPHRTQTQQILRREDLPLWKSGSFAARPRSAQKNLS